MKRLILFPILLTAAVITGVVAAIDVIRLARREIKLQAEAKRWAAERVGLKRNVSNDWGVN